MSSHSEEVRGQRSEVGEICRLRLLEVSVEDRVAFVVLPSPIYQAIELYPIGHSEAEERDQGMFPPLQESRRQSRDGEDIPSWRSERCLPRCWPAPRLRLGEADL